MYTTPAYFLGRLISQIFMQIWYPLIIIGILFYGLGINTEFSNLLLLVAYAILLNLSMVAQGFFFGTLSDDFTSAGPKMMMPMLLFMLTAGVLGNTTTFPTFIMWFSYVNPLRYACQGFFLRFVDHVRPI